MPHSTGLAYPNPVEVVAKAVVPVMEFTQFESALTVNGIALHGSSLPGGHTPGELIFISIDDEKD